MTIRRRHAPRKCDFPCLQSLTRANKNQVLKQQRVLKAQSSSEQVTELDLSSIYFGEGNGNPLQYSCLENPMDGGAWQAAVHGVARSRTRPERLHFPFSLSCIGEGKGNPLQCSCLENSRDRGAWWAAVYGVAQSWTRLKWLGSSSSSRQHIFTYGRVPFISVLQQFTHLNHWKNK